MNFQLTINKFMSIKKNYLMQKKSKKTNYFLKLFLEKKIFIEINQRATVKSSEDLYLLLSKSKKEKHLLNII